MKSRPSKTYNDYDYSTTYIDAPNCKCYLYTTGTRVPSN